MQFMEQVSIIAAIVVMIATVFYYVVNVRRNWDVTIRDKKKARMGIGLVAVLLLLQCIIYLLVYDSKPDNIWIGTALLTSSIVTLVGVTMAFKKLKMVKNSNMELLETLICVMEAGDPNLDGHSLHVHNLVTVFYDYLPTSYQQRVNFEDLKYASLFLDMGKLGIPRNILTKSGKLTAEEMALMKRHPEICVNILSPVGSFSNISDWILYHHERVDGNGYHKLKGEDIPLASRMIAIADTYSALTMDRTYKASLTYDEALTELRQAAGTQLDPELVGFFCEIPKHRIEACMENVSSIMERYQDEHFR